MQGERMREMREAVRALVVAVEKLRAERAEQRNQRRHTDWLGALAEERLFGLPLEYVLGIAKRPRMSPRRAAAHNCRHEAERKTSVDAGGGSRGNQ